MVVSKRHRNNYGLKDYALVQSEANWVEREVCVQVEGAGEEESRILPEAFSYQALGSGKKINGRVTEKKIARL